MIQHGMLVFGRFSIGWNFHSARTHTTIALPLAISIDQKAVYAFIGPLTFVWLRQRFDIYSCSCKYLIKNQTEAWRDRTINVPCSKCYKN